MLAEYFILPLELLGPNKTKIPLCSLPPTFFFGSRSASFFISLSHTSASQISFCVGNHLSADLLQCSLRFFPLIFILKLLYLF
jgi:hypothetical protein